MFLADENFVENGKHPWRPLGQMLVDRGLIDEQQLEVALREHASSGEPIGSVLVALEYIPEETLRHVLLEQCGLDMTRQEGFGSGLLGQLERRGVGHRTAREPGTPVEPAADNAEAVESPPAREPEPVVVAATASPEPAEEKPAVRETVGSSIDSLLETFEERSRALTDELAAMRRLLHEIAG